MFRKAVSILLLTAILLSLFAVVPVSAEESSGFTTSADAISMLKKFEGFSKYPYYDYSQYTVGYGTRCPDEDYSRFAMDGITEEEAETLLANYLQKTEKTLNHFAASKGLSWTQNQFDALILFSYNCGTAWLYQTGEFRSAVLEGKTGEGFIYPITLWCSANGTILGGLANRRLCEANLYLNGIYDTTPPADYCYVKYQAQGGVTETRVEGYDASIGHAPSPSASYSGQQFLGWFTDKTGGTKVEVLDRSLNGKTLYAHWASTAPAPETTTTPTETKPAETTPAETKPAETTPAEPAPEVKSVEVTVTDYLNVHSGAGTGNSIIGTLDYGTKVTVTEVKESGGYKWGQISKGWICLYYTNYEDVISGKTETVTTEKVTGKVVDTNNLRVRSGPGFNYSVQGYLNLNTPVEITQQKTVDGMTWGKISEGWISMDYVRLDSDPEPEKPAEPETPAEPAKPAEKQTISGEVINSSYLNVRSGPGFSYGVIDKIYAGDKVEISEQKAADGMTWGHISKGWVSMDYIAVDGSGNTQTNTTAETIVGTVVNASQLRVRSGPGTQYSIYGYVNGGDVVTITETAMAGTVKWGKISWGWISMDYVQVQTGASQPETEPAEQPEAKPETGSGMTGTVTDAGVLNVRSNPGFSGSVIGSLSDGAKVTISETKYADTILWGHAAQGWISMDYVTLDSGTTANGTKIMTVTADYLNVRSGPGLGNAAVDHYTRNTKVEITEETTADGMVWGHTADGWISMDYVK